jgi:hypothetical protein
MISHFSQWELLLHCVTSTAVPWHISVRARRLAALLPCTQAVSHHQCCMLHVLA